jgi:diguanylate cyclase (GGDEF)-like protein
MRLVAAGAVAAVLLLASLAALLARADQSSRSQMESRFELRGAMAGRFIESFVADVLRRETGQGTDQLTGRVVDRELFETVVGTWGFEAAVLLDENGRALHVWPRRDELIGTELASKYPHLQAATSGRPAVSNVTLSASNSVPVVAFAAPFPTPRGRRVLSGGYRLPEAPLGSYVRSGVGVAEARISVVDGAGVVVADNLAGGRSRLGRAMPRHLMVPADGNGRRVDAGAEDLFVVSHVVAGTDWKVVVAAPTAVLYEPITGRWISWLVFAAFLLTGIAALLLLARLLARRRDLERVTRLDPLTGLANRRAGEEALAAAAAQSRRQEDPYAVLLIDVDRFKRVNDTFGHAGGDRVLCAVAERLEASLREVDRLARWGGEELIAVLPGTGAAGAAVAAERLRLAVHSPIPLGDGAQAEVTISIGVAHGVGSDPAELLRQADDALYTAKALGRDRWETSPAERATATM